MYGAFVFVILASALVQGQPLIVETGAGKQTLSRADLEARPHIRLTASEHGTSPLNFEGVTLKSVLEKAGVTFVRIDEGQTTGQLSAVEAADGYRVVVALPELDPAFTDQQTVLAFLRDGKPLGEKEGPFRVVIPDEKRIARWVRQVTTLKIVDVQ